MKNQYKLRLSQKIDIRKKIINGSQYYNKYLLNKKFLIITEDYSINYVTFLMKDFKHFTGLSTTKISDCTFFNLCLKSKISLNNIDNYQHYNYSTLKFKTNALCKLNKFIHADVGTNLFLSNLQTNTCEFPYAIRNDKENMTICFTGFDNHARSIRKAKNSKHTLKEHRILGIFKMDKNNEISNLIYVKNFNDLIIHLPKLKNSMATPFKKSMHIAESIPLYNNLSNKSIYTRI